SGSEGLFSGRSCRLSLSLSLSLFLSFSFYSHTVHFTICRLPPLTFIHAPFPFLSLSLSPLQSPTLHSFLECLVSLFHPLPWPPSPPLLLLSLCPVASRLPRPLTPSGCV